MNAAARQDLADTGMMPENPTVFVVDNDALTRATVCDLARSMRLRFEGFVSGQEFLEAHCPSRCGCLVTEVRVPDIGGLEIQRRLSAWASPLPVVFLTAFATVPIVVRAMQAGAVDFLEKPPKDQELWESIQEAINVDALRRERLSRQRERHRLLDRLSENERHVLRLLANGESRRAIASSLGMSVRTVELWRSRAMKKIEAETHTDLLRFAITIFGGWTSNSSDSFSYSEDLGYA